MSIEALGWALKQMAGGTLSPTTRFVLMFLANRADPEGGCYPSVRYIMRHTGLSERTIRTACSELRDVGLLQTSQQQRVDGGKGPNLYSLRLETPPPAAPAPTSPAPHAPTQVRHVQEVGAPRAGPDTKGVDELSLTGEAPPAPKNANRHPKPQDTSPVVIELPMRGSSTLTIRQQTVAELEPLYPAVDVPQTLREMKGWLIGHPERRPRRRMMGFVTNWLKKEQEEHGT